MERKKCSGLVMSLVTSLPHILKNESRNENVGEPLLWTMHAWCSPGQWPAEKLLQLPDQQSLPFFLFPFQIDPKVAFPRRAQPKVGVVLRLSGDGHTLASGPGSPFARGATP